MSAAAKTEGTVRLADASSGRKYFRGAKNRLSSAPPTPLRLYRKPPDVAGRTGPPWTCQVSPPFLAAFFSSATSQGS